ncbi:MAG TPA: protein kinase [Kofleriaceae bacterium]|nr:protein kinase [Kofleriaceae bacterium]
MLGEVIHGYRIDRALAGDKGGFGDVYFATHVDSGAEAVVKVLKPEMSAQRDIVARFFNEARAAASVHHPGVVQIHNVGYHGDRAYLLMERLHGDDLEGRLAGGPLPVDRAILFMRQAAGAVGAAHERGIVHRDLKPANLFVVADPDVVGGERVKVLDFGIAKLTVDAGAGKTQGVFGTPAYMSPEQCASTGAVDPRADLYSLGCIFYELVCGRPPFGQGGIELIASHLRDTPPPPRAIAPWVPPAVEQVILQLLEKQPDRRPPSCAALIAALDAAAAASGLPAASAAHLAVGGASMPRIAGSPSAQLSGGTWGVPHSTTLGASAGAATVPPARRGSGVWLGVGAVVVVAGAIAVVLAMPGRQTAGGGSGSGSAGSDGSAAIALVADAGAAAGPDAAAIAAAARDAAVIAPRPDAAIAAVAVDAAAADDPAGTSEAERLNEQGKTVMYANDYEQARRLFSQAIARDPQAKYFLNLATADLQLGYLDAAADALRNAVQQSPTREQAFKAKKLFAMIAREAEHKGVAMNTPVTPAESGAAPPEPPVASRSQAEIAAQLNEEGKNLMYADKYTAAAAKFQEAVARVPEAKYFVNLCTARLQEGKLDEALTACNAVELNAPTADQRRKATRLIQLINDEARKQNLELRGNMR